MRTNTGFTVCFFLLFLCSPALAAQASPQSVRNVGEVSASAGICADCGLREGSLNHTWMHGGGARLYWNTLTRPRQILMSGARFMDPASLPELHPAPVPDKSKPRAGRSRPRASRAAAPVAGPAPRGVGSTALQVPGAPKAPQMPAPAGGNSASKPDTPAAPPAPSSQPAEPAKDRAKESGQPRLRDILLPTGGASLPGAEAGARP